MIHSYSPLLSMCVVALGCAPTRAFRNLGPEQSLAPLNVSVHSAYRDTLQLDVHIARAAFVTVVALERHGRIRLLANDSDMTTIWLNPGPHRLLLRPARAQNSPTRQGGVATLPQGTGSPALIPDRIEGVGSIPLELCPDATPYQPRYCPVSVTEPLYAPPLPPNRYVLVVATEHSLDRIALEQRLTRVDLSADGRELLAEAAFYAGGDGRWGAYGIRR